MIDTTAISNFTAWFRLKYRIYDQNSCMHCLAAQARAWKHPSCCYIGMLGEQSDLVRLFCLTERQAKEVFFGPRGGVSRAQAVAMLEHLAATGIVDWNPPPLAET